MHFFQMIGVFWINRVFGEFRTDEKSSKLNRYYYLTSLVIKVRNCTSQYYLQRLFSLSTFNPRVRPIFMLLFLFLYLYFTIMYYFIISYDKVDIGNE